MLILVFVYFIPNAVPWTTRLLRPALIDNYKGVQMTFSAGQRSGRTSSRKWGEVQGQRGGVGRYPDGAGAQTEGPEAGELRPVRAEQLPPRRSAAGDADQQKPRRAQEGEMTSHSAKSLSSAVVRYSCSTASH